MAYLLDLMAGFSDRIVDTVFYASHLTSSPYMMCWITQIILQFQKLPSILHGGEVHLDRKSSGKEGKT